MNKEITEGMKEGKESKIR